MKNFKRVLAMTTAAVMAVTSFAGCSSNNANSGNVGGSTNVAEGEKTIVIGGSGPLTGDAAQYGVGVKNAIQLAVDEVNAAGGVNGNKLKLVFEDDEADSGDKAVNAYNTLKDQGMQILLGTVTTGSCLAVVDKSKQDNIFQFTPSASAQDVIANDNCFQICFTDPNQGKASADYIADNKVATKIGVIYDSSDAYSSGIYNAFKTEAAAKGLELVSEQSFTKDSKTDFSVQLKKIKDSGAELLFLPNYYSDNALILQQAHDAGMDDVKKFGVDGMDGILGVENFDTSLAEGVMLLTPFSATSTDEKSQKFVKAYGDANNGETPNQFAADTYDVIYAMQLAADDAKITPDMSNEDISAAMTASMANIELDGLTGKAKWTEDGECDKEPKAFEIKDGAYVEMK